MTVIDTFYNVSARRSQSIVSTKMVLLNCQVLWIIPYEGVRWCSIVVALCLSGSVLALTFWPAVRDDHPRVAIAIMSAIVALHILLAVGCKVRFCEF